MVIKVVVGFGNVLPVVGQQLGLFVHSHLWIDAAWIASFEQLELSRCQDSEQVEDRYVRNIH